MPKVFMIETFTDAGLLGFRAWVHGAEAVARLSARFSKLGLAFTVTECPA